MKSGPAFDACQKFVNNSGRSRWVFPGRAADSSEVCEVRYCKHTGRYMTSVRDIDAGEELFSEAPIAVHIGGTHQDRICYSCLAVGLKKAFVSESCRDIYFCSKKCMNEQLEYLDNAASLMKDVADSGHVHYRDQALLLLRVLYRARSGHAVDVSKIQDMEICQSVIDRDLSIAAAAFYAACSRSSKDLLTSQMDESYVDRLFRAVKYNAQPLPISSLPGTYFLCIFDSASKLNHSCSPNLKFVYGIGNAALRGSLVALKPIAAGDELSISYIDALNLRASDRHALLQHGFGFECRCSRCIRELKDPSSFSILFEGTKSELSVLRTWCADSNAVNRSDINDIENMERILLCQISLASSSKEIELFNRPKVSLYDLSDVSAAILQRLKFMLTTAGPRDMSVLALAVARVCFVLSYCWTYFGGAYSTGQLNILIYGLSLLSKCYQHDSNFLRSVEIITKKRIFEMSEMALKILHLETNLRKEVGVIASSNIVLYDKMISMSQLILDETSR